MNGLVQKVLNGDKIFLPHFAEAQSLFHELSHMPFTLSPKYPMDPTRTPYPALVWLAEQCRLRSDVCRSVLVPRGFSDHLDSFAPWLLQRGARSSVVDDNEHTYLQRVVSHVEAFLPSQEASWVPFAFVLELVEAFEQQQRGVLPPKWSHFPIFPAAGTAPPRTEAEGQAYHRFFTWLRQKTETTAGGMSMLDVGCKSGFLTAAAIRLGVRRVLATDFYRPAVQGTSEQLTNLWQRNLLPKKGNVSTLVCDLLPQVSPLNAAKKKAGWTRRERKSTFHEAAIRRKLNRFARGMCPEDDIDSTDDGPEQKTLHVPVGKFDLVTYHGIVAPVFSSSSRFLLNGPSFRHSEDTVLKQFLDNLFLKREELLQEKGFVAMVIPYRCSLRSKSEPSPLDQVASCLKGWEVLLHTPVSLCNNNGDGELLFNIPVNSNIFPQAAVLDQVTRERDAFLSQAEVQFLLVRRRDFKYDKLVEDAAKKKMKRETENLVDWNDSFEFDNYLPRDGIYNRELHWSTSIPTFSYLEDDSDRAPPGTLMSRVIGHRPAEALLKPDYKAVSNATNNFNDMFSKEIRLHRRKKVQSLLLTGQQTQATWIDKRAQQGLQVELDLVNELSTLLTTKTPR